MGTKESKKSDQGSIKGPNISKERKPNQHSTIIMADRLEERMEEGKENQAKAVGVSAWARED